MILIVVALLLLRDRKRQLIEVRMRRERERYLYVRMVRLTPITQRIVLFYVTLYLRRQADRGFAKPRLCTNEDGTTNNLVLYTVWNGTSKKGGNAPRAVD
jgi:hypothetical protein